MPRQFTFRKEILPMRKSLLCPTFFVLSLPLLAQTNYIVFDLGTLGGANTNVVGINNAGQVVGLSNLASGDTHGFRTAPNSPINAATDDIGTLGGTYSSANSVNSSGEIGGSSTDASGFFHAFRFDAGGIHDLGFYGGPAKGTFGNAINAAGQVTGGGNYSFSVSFLVCVSQGILPAFRTSANSSINYATDSLGTLLPGNCRYSTGYGINSSGQVVGSSAAVSDFNPEVHAMLATPGSAMHDLGLLGGTATFPAATGKHAQANGINDSGQIVGTSTYNGAPFYYVTHAFLTSAAGPMTDLGTLGGAWASAAAINATGQIVGNSTTAGDAAGHGFLYTGGVMNDLNTMIAAGSGWELVNATSINDNGQIVGTAWLNGVQFVNHAVRLDPLSQAIPSLITSLSSPTLGLTSGQISSLTTKLNNALASIQAGQKKQATNQLNAFISSVQTSL